jgi:hypothetical protein
MTASQEPRPRPFRALLGLLAALSAFLSFSLVGRDFYAGFQLPHGSGMYHLLPEELAFYGIFFIWGGVGWIALWTCLRGTSVPDLLMRVFRGAKDRGRVVALVAGLLVAAAAAMVGDQVLARAVVSDDEHVYQFIAQTLRTGRVTAPSPGSDLAFYREQFVVMDDRARYGKYPLGHPLLLAVGQAVGAEHLVVPVLSGLAAVLTYGLARALCGPSGALMAVALFATSPQVLLTGATYLSQPASAVALGGALACLMAADRRQDRELVWLFGAGACLAFGFLVRPLPGGLFIPVAFAYVALRDGSPFHRRTVWRLTLLGLPVLAALLILAAVNQAQAGSALVTAYGQAIAPQGGAETILKTTVATPAMRAMSLLGSLARLNFWLFGWPLSLALCLLARRSGPFRLLWGMVGAEVVYRLLTPKVGVGGTGPQYLFESVPLLAVLTADGVLRLTAGVREGARSPASLAALLAAGVLVNGALFLPSRLQDLARMGAAQRLVERLAERQGLRDALVFHEGVVPWWTRLSWAYFPRCNSPSLDDDILYVRLQRAAGLEENVEFWHRRHPTRSAWYFGYREGQARLIPLLDFIREPAAPPASP